GCTARATMRRVLSIVFSCLGCGPSVHGSDDALGDAGGDGGGSSEATTRDGGHELGSEANADSSSGGAIGAPSCPLSAWAPDRYPSGCCSTFLQPCDTVNHACVGAPSCTDPPTLSGPVVITESATCQLAAMAAGDVAVHNRVGFGAMGGLAIEVSWVIAAD